MHQYNIKPANPGELYYIKYSIARNDNYEVIEFWTDSQDEYENKLGFIGRHFNYNFIYSQPPLTSYT
jgi:hypothetical protein